MGVGYAPAKSVLVCGSCGLVMHMPRLVYKLASEPGPRPRLSAKSVCMDGNATSAVLDRVRGRGMAGGVNGNATPAGLGRARDRGVAGGFDAAEGACTFAQNQTCMFVQNSACIFAQNQGYLPKVCLCGNPILAVLGRAGDRGMAGGVNGNVTPAGLVGLWIEAWPAALTQQKRQSSVLSWRQAGMLAQN